MACEEEVRAKRGQVRSERTSSQRSRSWDSFPAARRSWQTTWAPCRRRRSQSRAQYKQRQQEVEMEAEEEEKESARVRMRWVEKGLAAEEMILAAMPM